ncbi:MAG TPA: hypothetical protein VNL91_10135, partial [Thermoanaerobaculia bacterium]|nr:hypothetical protein [Thermoanaerobaculia bacterium]
MKRLLVSAMLLSAAAAGGQTTPDNRANLTIAVETLGDAPAGVVTRVEFRFVVPPDVPPGIPLAIVGSASQSGSVRPFRYRVRPEEGASLSALHTFAPGVVDIEARLMIPLEEETPVIVGRAASRFTIAEAGRPYVAGENATAEAVIA